jgi:hypothetical protein
MGLNMKLFARQPVLLALGLVLCLPVGAAHATTAREAVDIFKSAGASASFFDRSYGYAVFPTVGAGALGVGGAFGKGRVYVHGHYVGDAKMGALSVGFQAGGKAYSEIIFFAATNGASAGASGTDDNATTRGVYYKGMAVFTVAKGGLMYSAAIAGQKFSFTPASVAH